jgi:hypothetical protein
METTLSEFRKRERREAEKAAIAAAEAQSAADAEAAKQRAESARQAEIQRQYVQYVNSQWAAEQSDEKICTWQHWLELTPGTRQLVSDLIAKNRNVRIGNL